MLPVDIKDYIADWQYRRRAARRRPYAPKPHTASTRKASAIMPAWRVRVEAAPPDASNVTLGAITKHLRLQDYDPYVVVEYGGHLAISVTVEARAPRTAFGRGEKAIGEALSLVGINTHDIVGVSVLSIQEHEHRQHRPWVPRLAGISRAAAIMGKSPTWTKKIAQNYPEQLPLVDQLEGETGAQIWLRESWVRFAETYKPKRTGRPPGTDNKATGKKAKSDNRRLPGKY